MKLLYIACSSYSGSTLLSFLLNTHPKVATAGHTQGWGYADNHGEIHCSCGEALEHCPFFKHIAKSFHDGGLPFEFRNFGTRHRLSRNERLDRFLTTTLPFVRSNRMERMRDVIVRSVPGLGATLRRQDQANEIFVRAALAYAGAEVYVDNSHRPHRLRNLSWVPTFDLYAIHLLRDPRGAVLSRMQRRNWDTRLAISNWINEQVDIVRILEGVGNRMTVYYEDICDRPEAAAAPIHQFVGLDPAPVPNDFKSVEHHILGNQMRKRDSSIARDVRWKTELSPADLGVIADTVNGFLKTNPRHPLSDVLRPYARGLDDASDADRRG